MKAEIQRRQTLTATLAAYFETRPYQIVTHAELVAQVGENYRSRIAEIRQTPRRPTGLPIENVPVCKADGTRGYGSYRFRPAAIGREADTVIVYADSHIGPLFDRPGALQRG